MGRGKRKVQTRTLPAAGPAVADVSDLLLWPDEPYGFDDPEAQEAVARLRALGRQELGRRLSRGLIVDLDDTLNVNMALFLRSRGLLTALFAELSPEREPVELAYEHREVSNALVETLGYGPARWRQAALDAAERFAGRALEPEERRRLLEAAEEGLGIGELYQGVLETLELLKEAEVPLVLLTKGEEEKQREKISGHGLERYFDLVRVVAAKDATLLRQVAAEAGLESPAVIGDSERSDVVPAQAAGFAAVLVDRGAPKWQLERAETAETPRATSFAAAVSLLAATAAL